MSTVERHAIEFTPAMGRAAASSLDMIPKLIAKVPQKPELLGSLLDRALVLLAVGSGMAVPGLDAAAMARLGAESGAGLFAAASERGVAVGVELSGKLVSVPGTGPTSTANPARWLGACYLAMAAGHKGALDTLCRVPAEVIERSPVGTDPWLILWINAVRALGRGGQPDTAAVRAALTPGQIKNSKPEIAKIFGCCADALDALLAKDAAAFNAALVEALTAHRFAWTRGDEALADAGFLAWGPAALAALAQDRGLKVSVSSDYLPVGLR